MYTLIVETLIITISVVKTSTPEAMKCSTELKALVVVILIQFYTNLEYYGLPWTLQYTVTINYLE